MKVALMNEFSQASKNSLILQCLNEAGGKYGIQIYNTGMSREGDEPYLTYIHLGIQAFLLLNSGAIDLVVTGCGTGQGANISLNSYPGVTCGLILDPADAYLFAQINNGNAVSLPFAKGFGWGAELNLSYIFERLFSCPWGMGYPPSPERKLLQNKNAEKMNQVKWAVSKEKTDILESLDSSLVLEAVSGERFQDCFFKEAKDENMKQWIRALLSHNR